MLCITATSSKTVALCGRHDPANSARPAFRGRWKGAHPLKFANCAMYHTSVFTPVRNQPRGDHVFPTRVAAHSRIMGEHGVRATVCSGAAHLGMSFSVAGRVALVPDHRLMSDPTKFDGLIQATARQSTCLG